MKYFSFLLALFFGVHIAFAQRTCLTNQKITEKIKTDVEFASRYKEISRQLKSLEDSSYLRRKAQTVVTVPVVVHVLYKNAAQNISDTQILSQIEVLNADFRKLNTDFSTVVPAVFQPYGADMEVNFCMASKTPTGLATTGIVRKQVPSTFVFGDEYYTSTGDVAWDTTEYLNIWIGVMDGDYDGILGWAYPPAASGLPYDGLAIDYRYYGTLGTATYPYNKGRTATHEIGHYFGLDHPWGDDDSLCGTSANNDGASDTPATFSPYYGCPTFPDNSYTCTFSTNGAMFMNYMDYTDDACMAFFTNGQKNILVSAITNYRSGLITSAATNCNSLAADDYEFENSIHIYPNPSYDILTIESLLVNVDQVIIYNINGLLIKNISIYSGQPIDVSNLSSGMYILKIFNEGQLLKTDKIVKM